MVKNKKLKKILIYSSAVAPMIFWGISYIWTKIVLQYYEPLTTIFLRLVISTIFLSTVIFFKKVRKIKKSDLKYFFLLAFFEPFCYFLGENFGMKLVSPTVASIIISTIPVITPIFAFIILKEKLSKLNILGLIISFTGVVLILTTKNSDLVVNFKGIMLLFLAAVSGVGYGITVRNLSNRYSPLTIVLTQNFIGTIYFLPLFLIFEFKDFISVTPNKELIFSILQLSIFASTLSFIFITYAIKNLGISKTNVFTNLIPIVTAIFSFFMLGKILTGQEIFGILVVISGLFLSQKKKSSAVIHEDL